MRACCRRSEVSAALPPRQPPGRRPRVQLSFRLRCLAALAQSTSRSRRSSSAASESSCRSGTRRGRSDFAPSRRRDSRGCAAASRRPPRPPRPRAPRAATPDQTSRAAAAANAPLAQRPRGPPLSRALRPCAAAGTAWRCECTGGERRRGRGEAAGREERGGGGGEAGERGGWVRGVVTSRERATLARTRDTYTRDTSGHVLDTSLTPSLTRPWGRRTTAARWAFFCCTT